MPATSPYRVLLCDLRTDRLLATLPLNDVSIDDYIGQAGSLSGTLPVPNRQIAEQLRPIVQAGRTAVWVERDRAIWWGGVLWTVTPTIDERGSATVALQAGTFDTYLDHRMVRDTYRATDVDQLDIARDLIEAVQQQRGGDIGIEYGTTTSGVLRSRTYDRHDQPIVRELLDELADVADGFEWRIACRRDPDTGRRVKQLDLGYPRLDRGPADLVLTHPGPVQSYSLPDDGTLRANVWQSRGGTANDNAAAESRPLLSRLFVDDDALAAGWPRLDGSSDYNTIRPDVLDDHALADFQAARRSQVIPEVTVLLGQDVTPNLLGRTVRLRLHDLWHPDGYDRRHRVVGISVTPPERGRPETADLTLEAASHGNDPR
ncbi:hypothetical protein [Streptomyces litchfieldiae]|uniref:Minor tail protein n=1 Tax=Streptomyces litchfieldiae TaxID=3075543 RepID=A0ABU2N0A8_9ACTN|nr:hypothetical protein [Streptomyces sp. DSM 44938]MDT0346754.1 hypothetical protein [Streptomyces sp. DSM 44938]